MTGPDDVLVHSGTREPPVPGETERVKPALRGVLHEVAFFVSLGTGTALVIAAPTTGARVATAIYALSMSLLFGVSALFHRHTWGPVGRRRLRRCDHSTIFIAIAGSYTPVAAIALDGWARVTVLCVVWGGAVAGIAVRQLWLDAPKWAIAVPYVVVGWAAVIVLPQLVRSLGGVGFALLLASGLAYTAGAIVYARKRPDPVPAVFGYHEVFHACTIVGAALQMVLIAFFVFPLAG